MGEASSAILVKPKTITVESVGVATKSVVFSKHPHLGKHIDLVFLACFRYLWRLIGSLPGVTTL